MSIAWVEPEDSRPVVEAEVASEVGRTQTTVVVRVATMEVVQKALSVSTITNWNQSTRK